MSLYCCEKHIKRLFLYALLFVTSTMALLLKTLASVCLATRTIFRRRNMSTVLAKEWNEFFTLQDAKWGIDLKKYQRARRKFNNLSCE